MKPTIKPTIQLQLTQAHAQNVAAILNKAFGSDLMAQVNRQGLDMDFLLSPAPKRKEVCVYVLEDGVVKSEPLMLTEHQEGILKRHNQLYLDGTMYYRYPETVATVR